VLTTVADLLEQLNGRGIRYCHWKSNWRLEETLAGATDLDLLVHRKDAPAFRALLHQGGFRPAIELGAASYPSVEHYHALDAGSGDLAHVHAYYRVISGGSLAKNYRLPLEEMLLGNVERAGPVNIPSKGAELVVFVLRMYLKHTSVAELPLVIRSWRDTLREIAWLATDDACADARALLPVWLPGLDAGLFAEALDGLRRPVSLGRRLLLARRLRRALRPFARHGRLRAVLEDGRQFLGRAAHRLRRSKRRLTPASGGAVIAFVGPEATGKSTLIAETERWLGAHYGVRRVHAGKPPSTRVTALPNALLPALRALLPERRSTRVAAVRASTSASSNGAKPFPLLFGIRSVFLAYDRRALLTRAFASSANGAIVLCDRYPSANGSPDGAQLGPPDGPGNGGPVRRWLSGLEARLYQDVPPPDLVIHLTAPLEVTLERNTARSKIEPEDYVISRHRLGSDLHFDRAPVRQVDTNRPLDESSLEIKRLIWEAL
jgi:thymidylate kinase